MLDPNPPSNEALDSMLPNGHIVVVESGLSKVKLSVRADLFYSLSSREMEELVSYRLKMFHKSARKTC
jgi:hypothetical protein